MYLSLSLYIYIYTYIHIYIYIYMRDPAARDIARSLSGDSESKRVEGPTP